MPCRIAIRLIVCAALFAATLGLGLVGAQNLAVVNYTADEGPAHPQVWCLFQDSRGYMWIGTSEGLSRWDGVRFSNFSAADGLHDLTVRTILEDNEGSLWLGTDNGVSRFDGRTFTSFAIDEKSGRRTVWSATKDLRGHLWFGRDIGGVAVWDGSAFRSFTTADGLGSDYVYSVFADSSDRLWLGHRGDGLTVCSVDAAVELRDCRRFTTADGLAHNEVRAFAEDVRGHVWIGTRGGGISRFDGSRFDTFRTTEGLASDDIYALQIDHRDQLVVGTLRHGITICDLPAVASCRSYGIANGLADDAVQSLAEDSGQSLWVGLSAGLSQLWSEHVESYTLRSGLPHHTVYSILVDSEGVAWVGTLDGLARVRRTPSGAQAAEIVSWKSEGLLPGYEVWSMARDRFGRLWIATERGMCQFENGRCREVLTAEDGLADTDLIVLRPSSDGSLWVGTINGASQIQFPGRDLPPTFRNLTPADGLSGAFVNAIAEDAVGNIWLGTDQGLCRWDGEQLTAFGDNEGLPTPDILSIVAMANGTLWMGTNGQSLIHVKPDRGAPRFEVHGTAEGIPEVVSALLRGRGNELLLGTGEGVLRLDTDDPGRGVSILERLNSSSGLAGTEVNALALEDGNALWIGTSGGLTRIDPRHRRPSIAPPRVTIERVRSLAGREWRSTFSAPSGTRDPRLLWLDESAIELDHDFAALRFDFRALAFTPQLVRYQSWLEGFEQGWSEIFTASMKEYTNLDPGRYTLKIRASVADGTWGEPALQQLIVIPAWWQTIWARVGGVLLLVALVAGGMTVRTSAIRRRATELERAVDERTDDLQRYALALEEHSQALDRANIRIRHADRVKSEFLANMSHELRTPLNSIIGFSEVLDRKLQDRADHRELKFLRNISRSGRYLLLLINNLLDLSKIEADRMSVNLDTVALKPLVEDTLRVVQGYAGDRSVAITLDVADRPEVVAVDVAKLNQILINLLSNAVKFSSKGDSVEVTVEPVPAATSALGCPSYRISVADHGPGISTDDQRVIFQAFRQATGSGHVGGTGLGLALVQRYVLMLGGRVDLESTLGVGTTFRVLLPVHPPPSTRTEELDSLATETDESVGSPCILVMDRDRQHFAPLAKALEEHGMLPVRAGDANEARRMAEGLHPSAMVALCTDRGTRDWSSFCSLAAGSGQLPVVLVSSAEVANAFLLSADRCLTASSSTRELVAAIQSCTGESSPAIAVTGVQATRRAELREQGLKVHEWPTGSEVALVLLDLDLSTGGGVLFASQQLPADVRRILLLPEHRPQRFEHSGISRPTTFDRVALEVLNLLKRQTRPPSVPTPLDEQ